MTDLAVAGWTLGKAGTTMCQKPLDEDGHE